MKKLLLSGRKTDHYCCRIYIEKLSTVMPKLHYTCPGELSKKFLVTGELHTFVMVFMLLVKFFENFKNETGRFVKSVLFISSGTF